EMVLRAREPGEELLGAGDRAREIMGTLAEQRLVDDRRGAERVGGVVERPVERLACGEPPLARILRGVLGDGWALVERVAEPLQQRLQVAPRVAVERGEDP